MLFDGHRTNPILRFCCSMRTRWETSVKITAIVRALKISGARAMNRNNYRLVYSGCRGMVVAVAETATAARKSLSGQTRARRRSLARGAGAFAAVALLGALPIAALAQIAPTPGTATQVIQTPNGLPQVDIAAPSGAGVSVNTYNQFDVQRNGAILNNSPTLVQTQQAGYINGNPNFAAGQSARIIVNQVNSTRPSQLRGYVEVAGNRAQVVLANPAGIVVDGGGFINTSRATLTTGQPYYGADGSLAGFNVNRGLITVQGAGFNAANVDQVDLISRAVQANAAIYAKNLNVVTGVNQVNHDTLSTTAIQGVDAAPGVSIDVSQLGGMYADRIVLVGTERGVGVSSAGVLAAQAGDLTLQSNGQLVLSGKTNASGNLHLAAQDGIQNSGTTYGAQDVSVAKSGALQNTGTLAAQRNLDVTAASVASSGTLGAGVNADGSVGTSGDLNVTAAAQLNATGQNVAGGALSFTGAGIDLTGAQTAANGDVALRAQGALTNQGGTLVTNGALTVNAGDILNRQGTIKSGGALTISGTSLDNTAGRIVSLGSDDGDNLSITTSEHLTNAAGTTARGVRGGVIAGDGNVMVQAGSLANHGVLSAQRTLSATVAGTLDNTQGTLGGNGHVALTAASLVNTQGARLSGASLSIRADGLDNSGGQIGTIANNSAAVRSASDISITTTGALSNAGGAIGATRNLSITSSTLFGGAYSAANDLTLDLQGDFTNTPDYRFNAGHDLAFTLPGTFTNAGGLISVNDLSVNAGDIVNSGAMAAGGLLRTRSNTLTNTGALVGGSVSLSAASTLANVGPTALIGASDSDGTLELLANDIQNRDDTTATDTAALTAIFGLGRVVLAGGKDANGR